MNKPFAITLDVGSSLANKTGSWRTERPVYRDLLPPCNNACPAGENIQAWLYEAEEGGEGYERAWRKLMEDNPFPAIMGRVCYHPCETACNRAQLDSAVGINAVERFLGDEAIAQGWTVTADAAASGRRVLVVGAGPSGLSAAYHLARLGHDVTVRDREEEAGGMMRWGIPRYRLPREILDAEVDRIVSLGVTLELGVKVTDVLGAMHDEGFDAVFLAVGAHIGKRAYVPAGEAARILDAVTVLHSMEGEEKPLLGRRVAVYGGGNTAMDVARTAKRLGATDAVVVYRRTRGRMPAHDFEVEEAEEEGVRMKWLSTVKRADAGVLTIERMELDETGFPQPTGELEELEADSVVLALGQETDLSLLDRVPRLEVEDGVVKVGPDLMTGRPGVFAGGDMVPAERTVTVRSAGIMSPPAKIPGEPVIRSGATSTTPSSVATPGTPSSRPRSDSCPSARTSASAASVSSSPVGCGKPLSSSSMRSSVSTPASACFTVESHFLRTPSSSASSTSKSWAGIRSRVRRYTTTASSAPRRLAVRAASIAVLPPP